MRKSQSVEGQLAESGEPASQWLRGWRLRQSSLFKVVAGASVAVVACCMAACGSSEEDRVKEAITAFYDAAADGDGDEACEQLTPAARTPAGGLRCEDTIDQIGRFSGENAERRLDAVEVRRVRVTGDRATAETRIPTQTPTTLQLRKVKERLFRWKEPLLEWKIDSVGAGAGGAF